MNTTGLPLHERQWGVTPPVSLAGPTEQEMAVNGALIDELKRRKNFESPEESDKRAKVLGELQKITLEFVQKVSLDKHMTESMARDAGGKIFTYGSYRLGVYSPGSDIDTLMVVPKHVTRENFFTDFEQILRNRPEATEITAVPDAYVPIIKFKFSGIPIDLIFARLALAQIPMDLTLENNNLLKNVEERCVLSLNGTRVTDEILRLVPNPTIFKHALRAIKLWAQQRAIYSNVMGFPGGVAWAMLVARICQLYPNAVSAVVVAKFFRILSQWKWPQPVLLKPIEDGPLQVRVWNPKIYKGDQAHRMPIITPAYPSMCSTHNITESTQKVIINEMNRAGDIVDKILIGSLPWSTLFAKHTFFHQYKYYLVIIAASKNAETQLKWSGLVESKVRQLVLRLEYVDEIKLAHPFNKSTDSVHYCKTEEEASGVTRGELIATKTENINMQQTAKEMEHTNNSDMKISQNDLILVYTTTWYIGLEVDKKDGSKKLDISWPSQEFYEMCRKWDKYNIESMNVVIRHIRNFDLPDNVFAEGEQRPVRPLKKIKKRKLQSDEKRDNITKSPDKAVKMDSTVSIRA